MRRQISSAKLKCEESIHTCAEHGPKQRLRQCRGTRAAARNVIGFFVSLFLSASAQRHKGCSAECDRFFCFTFLSASARNKVPAVGANCFLALPQKHFLKGKRIFFYILARARRESFCISLLLSTPRSSKCPRQARFFFLASPEKYFSNDKRIRCRILARRRREFFFWPAADAKVFAL